MKIWAISDLHLSFSSNKPMDIFGHHWEGHAEKMAKAWDSLVSLEDVVLCPGDLSWAMKLEEARLDLDWIAKRPGNKILGKGNHDYWWDSISKLRKVLHPTCVALQNDCVDLGRVVVCGARCWSAPGALDYTKADEKIYERELIRLKLSLEKAKKIAGDRPIIAALHYPPFDAKQNPTEFVKLLEAYGVKVCIYGHLHGKRSHQTAFIGLHQNIEYQLVACDYLNFTPKLIWEVPS